MDLSFAWSRRRWLGLFTYRLKARRKKKAPPSYALTPEARAFFEQHPEMVNMHMKQMVKTSGYGRTKSGSHTLYEPPADKVEQAEQLREAVNRYPESKLKDFMLDYLSNMSILELQKKYNKKNKWRVFEAISKGKQKVLSYSPSLPPPLKRKTFTPIAVKRFSYKGVEKFVTLVTIDKTREQLWIDEENRPLPEAIQEILDEHPDFKEWEDILL